MVGGFLAGVGGLDVPGGHRRNIVRLRSVDRRKLRLPDALSGSGAAARLVARARRFIFHLAGWSLRAVEEAKARDIGAAPRRQRDGREAQSTHEGGGGRST